MDLASWLGTVVADWPFWALVIVATLAALVWLFYIYSIDGTLFTRSRYEWPEDKKKRLAKKAAKNKAKVTKG